MKKLMAFDVYGTLIDTHGVVTMLESIVGDKAAAFSLKWREKQLEYSFRRGLMRSYKPFSHCTKDSLDFTCSAMRVPMTEKHKHRLLQTYSVLPYFQDVPTGLSLLKEKFSLVAFSNGELSAINSLLSNAKISHFFDDIVSADEIQTFKPDPAIYQHLLNRTNSTPIDTWLVSSNPFDVIGARTCQINAVWIQRDSNAVFDKWELEPSLIADSLTSLSKELR